MAIVQRQQKPGAATKLMSDVAPKPGKKRPIDACGRLGHIGGRKTR
jgi:hypothetical protein